MEVRDVLVDGVDQMTEWLDNAIKDLDNEQVNFLPAGHTTSIGFDTWHVVRTADNIINFVLQDRKPPIWIEKGYADRMGLPKVEQGTGMGMEDARGLTFDNAALREYLADVRGASLDFLKTVPMENLEGIQMIKPLGEMPKWRVIRQVVMTHGFMHLGEINHIKGTMGLGFFM
jgi:hypothetical protein